MPKFREGVDCGKASSEREWMRKSVREKKVGQGLLLMTCGGTDTYNPLLMNQSGEGVRRLGGGERVKNKSDITLQENCATGTHAVGLALIDLPGVRPLKA